ncbi:hypothetical protein Rs2_15485 [Raphanus sativus]|nr:hypothetical protein Rs2_15485 [Raphanus sativus]
MRSGSGGAAERAPFSATCVASMRFLLCRFCSLVQPMMAFLVQQIFDSTDSSSVEIQVSFTRSLISGLVVSLLSNRKVPRRFLLVRSKNVIRAYDQNLRTSSTCSELQGTSQTRCNSP